MFDQPGADWDLDMPITATSTVVRNRVRLCMLTMRKHRLLFANFKDPQDFLDVTSDMISDLALQYTTSVAEPSASGAPADPVLAEKAAKRTRDWMFSFLRWHFQSNTGLARERVIFRSAIELDEAGQREKWSDQQSFYMAFANDQYDDLQAKVKAAFVLALRGNFATHLATVKERSVERLEWARRAAAAGAQADDVRSQIANRVQKVGVDHFACAIPLSTVKDVHEPPDQGAACSICHNSFTDMEAFSIEELLADYPVQIKYCGHIVGKACLELWMDTPKINEAKYPFRTCPLCRVKIEGVPAPTVPAALQEHVKKDMKAILNIRELEEMAGLEIGECLEAITACMSEEIAVEQLLAEISRKEHSLTGGLEARRIFLEGKLDELKKEKWTWGFRGNMIWKRTRDEWMTSDIVRRSH